jgi:DNA replication and repair protein RecF
MSIISLRIKDFRNLAALDLTAHPCGLNIIYGSNGSGKTNLLEAIYYLGAARSFRLSYSAPLIRHQTDKFSIFAKIDSPLGHIPLGLERDKEGSLRLRIAERDIASSAELAYLLPIRILNSQSHSLFEAGPIFRRKYLDWGLFYHSENFLSNWRHFERVLKQRNLILRDKRPKFELEVWTRELIKYGSELDGLRRAYINQLIPFLVETTKELLGIFDCEFSYYPGWNEKSDFAATINQHYLEELRCGYTLFGPHRADFDITYNTMSAKHFLSRGQQKLLICAMILAQGRLLANEGKKGLIYLIDDLPSELDIASQAKLISLLANQQTQIFVTAIEKEAILDWIKVIPKVPRKMFHVEQGDIVSD